MFWISEWEQTGGLGFYDWSVLPGLGGATEGGGTKEELSVSSSYKDRGREYRITQTLIKQNKPWYVLDEGARFWHPINS